MSLNSQSSTWSALVLAISFAATYFCLVAMAPGSARMPKRPGFVDVAPRSKITYISNNSPGGP